MKQRRSVIEIDVIRAKEKAKKDAISKLTDHDLSVLKYYKEGRELCGFENPKVWENLHVLKKNISKNG